MRFRRPLEQRQPRGQQPRARPGVAWRTFPRPMASQAACGAQRPNPARHPAHTFPRKLNTFPTGSRVPRSDTGLRRCHTGHTGTELATRRARGRRRCLRSRSKSQAPRSSLRPFPGPGAGDSGTRFRNDPKTGGCQALGGSLQKEPGHPAGGASLLARLAGWEPGQPEPSTWNHHPAKHFLPCQLMGLASRQLPGTCCRRKALSSQPSQRRQLRFQKACTARMQVARPAARPVRLAPCSGSVWPLGLSLCPVYVPAAILPGRPGPGCLRSTGQAGLPGGEAGCTEIMASCIRHQFVTFIAFALKAN